MNLSDVSINYSEFKNRDLLEVIFEKQKVLIDLYKVPTVDLDIPADQQILRTFAWCIVEEAAEALDVYWGTDHKDHKGDEVADMFHFYVELMILSGFNYKDFLDELNQDSMEEVMRMDYKGQPSSSFEDFVTQLAISINVLKNRFWRETNLKTDQ